MKALATYRGLLANRPLARLLGGEFVSAIGDWLYIVALLVVIYVETGDPLILGLFGAARVVPYIVLSLPAGLAADRFDRRLILLVTDLARGATMLAIRQGDPWDRFYTVAEGEFVVPQTGPDGTERELRRLGPDAVFGELGLLRGAPRSATVEAATDGRLLALDASAFLELAGAATVVRRRLLELYASGDDARAG